jgi:hypothetical protein
MSERHPHPSTCTFPHAPRRLASPLLSSPRSFRDSRSSRSPLSPLSAASHPIALLAIIPARPPRSRRRRHPTRSQQPSRQPFPPGAMARARLATVVAAAARAAAGVRPAISAGPLAPALALQSMHAPIRPSDRAARLE